MNAEYEKFVGGNIRKLREERRLTQEQLSAKLQILGCDITRSALAKIEVGQRHLYPDELYFLKQILAVPPGSGAPQKMHFPSADFSALCEKAEIQK